MLIINIPAVVDVWDDTKEEFLSGEEIKVTMEHSLKAISEWESRHHKHFLHNKDLTQEDLIDYYQCMIIEPKNMSAKDFIRMIADPKTSEKIAKYVNDPHTATTFSEAQKNSLKSNGVGRDIITAEIVYYWMVSLQIPFECENWNINKLLTLIQVCNIKNTPPKKMNMKDAMSQQRSINAARRAKLGSKG